MGRGNANVAPGLVRGLPIALQPPPRPGILELHVSWPEGRVAQPAISARLIGSDGAETELPFSMIQQNRGEFAGGQFDAGTYTLALQLYDDETVVAAVAVDVRIEDNARTRGAFEFHNLNKPAGGVNVAITPELDPPLSVSIAGGRETVAPGETVALAASADNAFGKQVFYRWYLNGVNAGSGETLEVGPELAEGLYRLDAVGFTSGGRRSGSASYSFQVVGDDTGPPPAL